MKGVRVGKFLPIRLFISFLIRSTLTFLGQGRSKVTIMFFNGQRAWIFFFSNCVARVKPLNCVISFRASFFVVKYKTANYRFSPVSLDGLRRIWISCKSSKSSQSIIKSSRTASRGTWWIRTLKMNGLVVLMVAMSGRLWEIAVEEFSPPLDTISRMSRNYYIHSHSLQNL